MDGIKFHLVGMKGPDYVMMFMTTYGTLGEVGNVKKWHYLENVVKRVKTFQYPEVVHNHYKYHDVIDNHNSSRMHPISMEETWMTMRCRTECFVFYWLSPWSTSKMRLNKPKIDSLQLRRLIAEALINNEYLQSGVSPRSVCKRRSVDHVLLTVPHFKKFVKGRLVNCKTKYGKWKCTDCSRSVRSYCSCTPGLMYCTECYANHCADMQERRNRQPNLVDFKEGLVTSCSRTI